LRIIAHMPRSTINFDVLRKIGLTLPDVKESTAYGASALKVHGNFWRVCLLTVRLSRVRLWFGSALMTAPNCSQPLPMFTR